MGLTNEQILEVMKKNNGILQTSMLPMHDIPSKKIQKMAENGEIERIAKGLYLHPDFLEDEYFTTSYRIPKGIFSYESALYLHRLSDENPIKMSLTLPSGWNSRLLKDKFYQFHYLKEGLWEMGQEKIQTPFGNEVLAYSKERTLAEMISKIKNKDRNLILNALKLGLKNHILDKTKLLEYANIFKQKDLMRAYLEVIK